MREAAADMGQTQHLGRRLRAALPWAVVVLGSLLLGLWVVLGRAVSLAHADTLIPSLVSLQRWTLFYWGQDRWGMLLPALAMPIRHPLANLLTQLGLSTAAALLVVPMLHQYLLRPGCPDDETSDDESKKTAGRWAVVWSWLVGSTVLLGVASGGYQMDLFFTQPYGLGLVLGVGGMLVLDRLWRITARGWRPTLLGILLLSLSAWVNLAGLIVLGPLTVWRIVTRRGWAGLIRSRGWVQLLAVGAAGLLGNRLRLWSPSSQEYGWLPIHEWPEETWRLIENAARAASPATGEALLLLAVLGLASQIIRPDTAHARRIGGQALGLLGIALLHLIVASANRHVANNDTAYRYALPAFLLTLTAAAIISSLMWVGRPRLGWPVAGVLLAGLLGLALALRHGPPSYPRVRDAVDQKFGLQTQALLATEADFVAGQYWDVWHAVFHANLTLYENGAARRIYGLTHRGDAARDRWPPIDSRTLIAVPRTPESREHRDDTFRHFALPPLRQVEATDAFELWSPIPSDGSASADFPRPPRGRPGL